MKRRDPQLITALDVDTFVEAQRLVDALKTEVHIFKIGSQLFTSAGPAAVSMVQEAGGEVFLDLKYHDIPQTVYRASSAACGLTGVVLLTVHIAGGMEMLKECVRGSVETAARLKRERPRIVGVTVLTSEAAGEGIEQRVVERARMAREAGLDGVVCSVGEAAAVRQACGEEFLIVTPGIRPAGAPAQDQKRVATVEAAVAAGSDYLVIGRPIIEADDPQAAARQAVAALQSAQAAL